MWVKFGKRGELGDRGDWGEGGELGEWGNLGLCVNWEDGVNVVNVVG